MQYRRLGSAGVQVSVIGLGGNRLGLENKVPQEAVNRMVAAAHDAGINFIDTANAYTGGRSEESLGIALKGRWEQFVLATKFSMPSGEGPNERGASRYHMLNALEASLRRLQSDHIDLYYVHRWDENTPVEETLRALDDAVRSGKVRYVGASNFAAWQLAYSNLLAEVRGWSRFVCVQSEYNMFNRALEQEVVPYCQAHDVGIVPYFPLAGGFLSGKYQRGQAAPPGSRGEKSPYVQGFLNDATFDVLEKLQAWAEAHGQKINTLAQAWLMAQPRVCSVITGATSVEQIQSNAVAGDWNLNADEVREVTAILDGGVTA
jgi:aryl-alcohol dehydrogenase-like predicted oxidoreductase